MARINDSRTDHGELVLVQLTSLAQNVV